MYYLSPNHQIYSTVCLNQQIGLLSLVDHFQLHYGFYLGGFYSLVVFLLQLSISWWCLWSLYGFPRVLYYMFGPFLCSIYNNLFSVDILFDIATTIRLICNVKFYYALPIYCDHFAPLLAPSAASLIFLAACVPRQYRVIFVHGRALANKAINYISAPTMILYNIYNI